MPQFCPRTWMLLSPVLLFYTLGGAQGQTSTWLGGSGNWTTGAQWSTNPIYPNNGTTTYDATVSSGTANLDTDIAVNQFSFGNGTSTIPGLTGAHTLTVGASGFSWNNASIAGTGTLDSNGATTVAGPSNVLNGWTINLGGQTSWTGTVAASTGAAINNQAGGIINFVSGGISADLTESEDDIPTWATRSFDNLGTINVNAGSGSVLIDASFTNTGSVNVNTGNLTVGNSTVSGGVSVASGATITFQSTSYYNGSPAYTTLASTSNLSGAGNVNFTSTQTAVVMGSYNIAGTTSITGGGIVFHNPIQNLGSAVIIGGVIDPTVDLGSSSVQIGTLTFTEGTLEGSGTINVSGAFKFGGNGGANTALVGTGVTNALGGVQLIGSNGVLSSTLNVYGVSSADPGTSPYVCSLDIGSAGTLNVEPTATFNAAKLQISGSSTTGSYIGNVHNSGTFIVNNPALNSGFALFGSNFVNDGTIQITNSEFRLGNTTFTQKSGSFELSGSGLAEMNGGSTFLGGTISGNGTIYGTVTSGALIAPDSGGMLTMDGLSLTATSELRFVLGGETAALIYSQLVVKGAISLNGMISLSLAPGASFSSTDVFTIISSGSESGTFDNGANGQRLITADGQGSFVVHYSADGISLDGYEAVPETSTISLFLVGVFVLAAFKIKRERQDAS